MRARLSTCVAAAFFLILATPAPRAAAVQLADSRVNALVEEADRASLGLKFEIAHAKADDAIALAEKIGDRVGLAIGYRIKGRVCARQGRSHDSAAHYERALTAFDALGIKEGMASALTGLAATSVTLGEFTRAREYGDRAFSIYADIDDDRGRANLLVILIGTQPRAERAAILEKSWTIAERLDDDRLRGDVLKARASEEFGTGNYSAAARSYSAAIEVLQKIGDVYALASTYVSYGRVFRAHGDYEGALQRYRKAIDLLEPTPERYALAEALNASAIAMGLLGRTDEALALYERGLGVARESGNQRLIDFMEGNLAGGLMAAGQYARAIPALESVMARKPEPSIAGYRYSQLGVAFAKVGRPNEAVGPASEGLRIARELKQTDELARRLDNRAWILSLLGRLDEALVDAREAVATLEQIRANLVPSDFLKRGYSDRTQRGYVRIVDLLSRAGRASEALEFAERGRARAFLDLLAARESGPVELTTRGGIATSSTSGRPDLGSEAAGKTLDLAGIRAVARRLQSTIVTYGMDDEATIIWVVRPDAEPVHVRVPITREKLTALVAATTAPLRETGKATTTRGAADDASAETPPQARAEDLAALPLRGLGLMALSRDDKSAWRELYKTLIEPIRAQLPARGGRITIVPHGPLFHLSFAALQGGTGRYLVEDYELHYAPAISVLEFTGRRQLEVASNAAAPWAIVGNPATLPVVNKHVLPPLPGAAREIASIAALAPKGGALRLDRAGADEVALSRMLDASHPSLLHFATHGFVFDDPKTAPFLALNRRGTAEAEDGRLTLDEVYGLELSTDLVVLSACRTGSGQVSSDGIVGLTRGFFYAGSPSVMATFWDVTDEATAILMTGFYRGYAKAGAKGRSLRTAQLALLADLRAGRVAVTVAGRRVTLPEHPLLWAAFFLSGEP